MAAKKIYEGQELIITLNTYYDLSSEVGNTAIQILDPEGIVYQVDADIVSPATNGQITYTFPPANGTEEIGLITGDYKIQALLKTQNIPGETFTFHVYQRFN